MKLGYVVMGAEANYVYNLLFFSFLRDDTISAEMVRN